jgi:hypothetical protein
MTGGGGRGGGWHHSFNILYDLPFPIPIPPSPNFLTIPFSDSLLSDLSHPLTSLVLLSILILHLIHSLLPLLTPTLSLSPHSLTASSCFTSFTHLLLIPSHSFSASSTPSSVAFLSPSPPRIALSYSFLLPSPHSPTSSSFFTSSFTYSLLIFKPPLSQPSSFPTLPHSLTSYSTHFPHSLTPSSTFFTLIYSLLPQQRPFLTH